MVEVLVRPADEVDVRLIEAEVAEVAGTLNAAHGRLVELAARLIETEAWRGHGIKSVEHWLSWHAGLSHGRAAAVTAVARRRADLPTTVESLARGELSVEQVREIARFVPGHNDAEAAALARVSTVSQLRNTLARYRFEPDAGESGDAAEPAPDPAARRGTASMTHDGLRFGLHVDAPLDDGAIIEQALTEAKDALFGSGHAEVTWMDAVVEVCRRSLDTVTSEGRSSRYRVYVHLDTDGGWLNAGPALPDSLMGKICCDGVVVPVWETTGAPVNVGRSQRIVPDRTRRLVTDRDRGCVVPGCGSRYHLEVHHLVAWQRGGRTDTDNLACLCPFHHDALHRGELCINGNADRPETLSFVDGLGREMPGLVPPLLPQVPPRLDVVRAARPRYQRPPGERIDNRCVHFTPKSWDRLSVAGPNAPPT